MADMKIAVSVSWVFIVLCCVMPIAGMDEARYRTLMANVGVHLDLMDAAKGLPSCKDDEKHLCIKELRTALSDFRLEKTLYDKDTPGTIPVKILVTNGDRALQGARFLINNLIEHISQNEAQIKKLEQELNTIVPVVARIHGDLEKKIKEWNATKEQLEFDCQVNKEAKEKAEAQIKVLRKSGNIRLLISWLIAPILGCVLLKLYQQYYSAA